jgi:hypothetical protein
MLIIIIYFVQHYKTWNILRNLILWLEMDVINVRVRKKLEWAINRYKKYLNWKIIIICQNRCEKYLSWKKYWNVS